MELLFDLVQIHEGKQEEESIKQQSFHQLSNTCKKFQNKLDEKLLPSTYDSWTKLKLRCGTETLEITSKRTKLEKLNHPALHLLFASLIHSSAPLITAMAVASVRLSRANFPRIDFARLDWSPYVRCLAVRRGRLRQRSIPLFRRYFSWWFAFMW